MCYLQTYRDRLSLINEQTKKFFAPPDASKSAASKASCKESLSEDEVDSPEKAKTGAKRNVLDTPANC